MILHQTSNSKSSDNFNAFFYTDQNWDSHFHKNFELIYVYSGKVICSHNGETYTLSKGDMGLCLSYEVHSYSPCENALYWVCVFSEEFVKTFAKKVSNKQGKGFIFKCNIEILKFIEKQLINNENPSVLIIKSCLYAICSEYLRNIPLLEQDKKRQHLIFSITEYIEQNHKNKITLLDLSEHLGYDYHYISRCFAKIFNMSFTEFLNLYRLENALNMLIETNKNITEIALESGFQSVRNFNNCFKNYYRISPSQYRKQKDII